MFERFTDRARRVVALAQEEARVMRHNYIGTEHLLIALAKEGDGVAARALTALGVNTINTVMAVRVIIGEGQAVPTGHIPFTPRCRKALELALREALQLGHNYIGTEHLLLGLIREGNGIHSQILELLNVELTQVRAKVVEILSPPRPTVRIDVVDTGSGGGGIGGTMPDGWTRVDALLAQLQRELAALKAQGHGDSGV